MFIRFTVSFSKLTAKVRGIVRVIVRVIVTASTNNSQFSFALLAGVFELKSTNV